MIFSFKSGHQENDVFSERKGQYLHEAMNPIPYTILGLLTIGCDVRFGPTPHLPTQFPIPVLHSTVTAIVPTHVTGVFPKIGDPQHHGFQY